MYVIVYKDYYANIILWAGTDGADAIAEAKALRQMIVEKEQIIDTDAYPKDRYMIARGLPVTMYDADDPDRICVMHNYRKYAFSCCCFELGRADNSALCQNGVDRSISDNV